MSDVRGGKACSCSSGYLTVQQLDVTVEGGAVSINESASVVTVDVETSNGVIHVIDSVLVPSSL